MDKSKIIIGAVVVLFALAGFFYKKHTDKQSSFPDTMMMGVELQIENPYAFATAASAKNGAAFMVIENATKQNDTLVNAYSEIATHTEIHENIIDPDDGQMIMRKIPALNIPKNTNTLLEPKGYHIMFIGLKQALEIGQSFSLTLSFEKSGDITVTVQVITPGSTPAES
jgi:copper(I)-binding protein